MKTLTDKGSPGLSEIILEYCKEGKGWLGSQNLGKYADLMMFIEL
jgi:hypothetical protein